MTGIYGPGRNSRTRELPRLTARCALALALLIGDRSRAQASIDPACDRDADGIVDGYDPRRYSEMDQQIDLLNFYGETLAVSPMHSPAPLRAFSVKAAVALKYVPQLKCLERTVFYGTKTENTNRTPVMPDFQLSIGLPLGFYAGVGGVPPLPVAGVRAAVLSAELGYGGVLHEEYEFGLRAVGLWGRIVGGLADPVSANDPAVDDVYTTKVLNVDASAGYRITAGAFRLVPYLGVGYTAVRASFLVGEDGVVVPNPYPPLGEDFEALHKGPTEHFGVQVARGPLQAALEIYLAPTAMRLFSSPRLSIGYIFR